MKILTKLEKIHKSFNFNTLYNKSQKNNRDINETL